MSKFDAAKPLFVGASPARGETVFDALRQAVRDLDKGEGVSYSDLEAKMLADLAPKNAKKYDGAYVKAYTRDAVTKFNYLSQDAAAEYSVQESKAKASSADKPVDAAFKLEIMRFIREKGEVSSVEEIDASQITVETLVSELGRKNKTVMKAVTELEEEGAVRTEQRESSLYVFLTEAGWDRLIGELPNVVAQEAAEEQQAALRESSGVAAETGEVVSPEAEGEYNA